MLTPHTARPRTCLHDLGLAVSIDVDGLGAPEALVFAEGVGPRQGVRVEEERSIAFAYQEANLRGTKVGDVGVAVAVEIACAAASRQRTTTVDEQRATHT